MAFMPCPPRSMTPSRVTPRNARTTRLVRGMLVSALALGLAGCGDKPLDFDLRGLMSDKNVDTAAAARGATANRPTPDRRGIISYPNYQVAVARRNDTLVTLGNRIGANPTELARFNGMKVDDPLRPGEIVALPKRVAEPSPQTGAASTGPIRPAAEVNVTEIASNAIDQAKPTPARTAKPKAQTGLEPIRHKVERGETAFIISRLYNVSVRALADWNGLDSNFTIREGQYLLIPTARENAPKVTPAAAASTPKPGVGSATPTPPSATKPLPKTVPPSAATPVTAPPPPKLETSKPAPSKARMVFPVKGPIIRDYKKGRNEGIDISAAAGTSVKAADGGTVAAITSDADQVPIVVLKHPGNVLTVYANVTGITVKKGDRVTRGQSIAKVRDGKPSYMHFEVREGFESVNPMPYLR